MGNQPKLNNNSKHVGAGDNVISFAWYYSRKHRLDHRVEVIHGPVEPTSTVPDQLRLFPETNYELIARYNAERRLRGGQR